MTKLRRAVAKKALRYTALSVAALVVFHVAYVYVGPTAVYLIAQLVVAIAANVFAVVYHATARWWKSAMGRNIMLLVGSIAGIVDVGLAFNIMGRPEWMREVFAALFFAVGVALLRRLWILIDAQYHSEDWTTHRNRDKPTA